MVEYHFCKVFSSAFCIACSQSERILSNCATAAAQVFSSTFVNVSLLSPLNASCSTPLNLSSDCLFQKIRCVVSCAMEWLSELSFQFACSAVNPAIAVSAGTNQSFTL